MQAQKFDPYLNVDPGTMSPFQHGEVFVTEDGAETDLDIGHYERFVDENMSRNASHSAGAIWDAVLRKERKGEFLGATVQVIPHITNEIKARIKRAAKASPVDVVISEIGGTVGDIESLPFLEAIRQFRREVGPENVLYLHCTLVPFIEAAGEMKTKPTQHSVNELRRIGIHPDVIVCRSHEELSQEIKDKIALFADVDIRSVVASPGRLRRLPRPGRAPGAGPRRARRPAARDRRAAGRPRRVAGPDRPDRRAARTGEVTIALVGKYVKLHDAYLSVHEALKHAGVHQGARVRVQWVDAEDMSYEEAAELLEQVDGVLVPGGFGSRGWEGKILACQVARERGIPYLGICLGMHVAVSEFARHVGGLEGANSTEMDPETPFPVIDLLPEQKEIEDLGGTMRLGAQAVELAEGTRTRDVYDEAVIHERHRHRYEVNNQYRDQLIEAGLVVSGTFQEGRLVEIVELPEHPWFVASQFHPEFKSRPTRPAPLFREFVGAALERSALAHRRRAAGDRHRRPASRRRASRRRRRAASRRPSSRRRGSASAAPDRPCAATSPCRRPPGLQQRVVVGGRVVVDGDVRDAEQQQLLPVVAEQLARVGVDREILAVVVGDEDGDRAGVEGLSDQALLDKVVRDGGGHGQIIEGSRRFEQADPRDLGSAAVSSVLDLFTELCALPSPPGEERDVADRVTRELRALGLGVDRGRRRRGDRLDDREPALPAAPAAPRAARRSSSARTSTPCRRRAARAGPRRGRDRAEHGRDDPRRRQQVGGRGDDRGGAPDRRGGGGRMQASSCCSRPRRRSG